MSGFDALHVTASVATTLERLGYSSADPYLSEIVPTAARGNNLVAVIPPAAVHAVPGIAGALSALAGQPTPGLMLMLVPEAALAEWEATVLLFTRGTGPAAHAVRSLARATRLLHAGAVQVLITTPTSALALVQRSALKTDRVTAVFLAWPENWPGGDVAVAPLMQDLGREIQRIVYTSEPERVNDLVERYARRALTVGPATVPAGSAEPASSKPRPESVRYVSTPWSQRNSALREVLEVLDPADCTVWTATKARELAPELPAGIFHVPIQVPETSLIVAYDLPTPAQLAGLIAAAPVVLLVPPTALSWVRRVVASARLLRLPGAADEATTETSARRARIVDIIDSRPLEGGLLALAPLFERHDPATVAAALYQLWLERPGTAPAPAPATEVMNAATARLWLGVGKKDGATPNDFVAVLTKDIHLDRSRIGKIEVRELYSLVEVPANDAEALVSKMNGVTIRRRRITARIDRGGKARSDRQPVTSHSDK